MQYSHTHTHRNHISETADQLHDLLSNNVNVTTWGRKGHDGVKGEKKGGGKEGMIMLSYLPSAPLFHHSYFVLHPVFRMRLHERQDLSTLT